MAWFGSANSVTKGATPDRYHGPLAPGPVAPINLLAGNPPPDPNLAASTAVTAARDAARKQKKKAAAGDTLLTMPAAGVKAIAPPKSLLGAPPKSLLGY